MELKRRRAETSTSATFSIDRELLRELRARAKKESVSLSAFVEYALRKSLDEPLEATSESKKIELGEGTEVRSILRAARTALERVDELI